MSAQRRRQTEGGTRRMLPYSFVVRRPNGAETREHFYATTKAMAAKYAHAWCRRMNYSLVEDEDEEREAA